MKILCLKCDGRGYDNMRPCLHCKGKGFVEVPKFKPVLDKDVVKNGIKREQ